MSGLAHDRGDDPTHYSYIPKKGVKKVVKGSPENMELAQTVWKNVLGVLPKEDYTGHITRKLKKHLKSIISLTALALDEAKADPRGNITTIKVILEKNGRKQTFIKLRFRAIGETEVLTTKGKKKKYIWAFLKWDFAEMTEEGWTFQHEIDLTEGKPKLFRTRVHKEYIKLRVA